MPRQQGLVKTGGRQKGSANKKTQLFKESLELLQLDIPTKIHDLLNQVSPEKQLDILVKLMPYVFPQLKQIEIAHDATDESSTLPDDYSGQLSDEQEVSFLELALQRKKSKIEKQIILKNVV